MNITQLLASYKRDLKVARKQMGDILDANKSNDRMSVADSKRCDALTAQIESLRDRIENAENIEREEQEFACPFTGAVHWRQLMAGSGGSQGFPAMALLMASSAVMPWAAAVSR